MLKIYSEINEDFLSFLENDNNERIFFSANFGMGKTTFLKQFANRYQDQFNCVHIYPVNYSVSSNSDIFRYIKFDILASLILHHGLELKNTRLDQFQYLPAYLKKNFHKLFLPLLIWKGESFGLKLYQQLEKEIKEFISAHKEDTQSEEDIVDAFADSLLMEEGSIYEKNIITETIAAGLDSIKSELKQNVLIIDDLDRLDPKHIFRILNVLSAHFDTTDDYKKIYGKVRFNFDKIIIVGHLKNIKNIYNHFYGKETDFNGYFNKFYSTISYRYDNNQNLNRIVHNIVSSIYIDFIDDRFQNQIDNRVKRIKKEYLIPVLKELVTQGLISIRQLLKYSNSTFQVKNKIHVVKKYLKNVKTFNSNFQIAHKYLELLLGSNEKVLEVLDKAIGRTYDIDVDDDLIRFPLLVLSAGKHKFKAHVENQPFTYQLRLSLQNFQVLQTTFQDRTYDNGFMYVYKTRLVEKGEVVEDTKINIDYFKIIYDALKESIELGFIDE